MKSNMQPLKGFRDFYPEQMAFKQWLYSKVKRLSEKYGYQEFDGPEVESLDLYANKTSQEILREQVFILKDRDGRDLALRPEITPTFARMVAQKSEELLQPIRWFCFGRGWRYEQPQKGRGREFFQWEINILGPETPEADAEILAIAADYFMELGLTPDEVEIKVNDRSYFEQFLSEESIDSELFLPLLRIIDRKEKVTKDEFDNLLKNEKLTNTQISSLNKFLESKDYSRSNWLSKVFKALESYPKALDYITFDPTIARGFDYYTRTVFEATDKTGNLRRALFGGGRFDNLTETIGGKRIPGIGMAPGDMPIEILLRSLGKLPDIKPKTATVLVTVFSDNYISQAIQIGNRLRGADVNTEIYPDSTVKLDKQLKYASKKEIPYVVVIGPDEVAQGKLVLKDMTTREQKLISFEDLIPLVSN